MAAQPLSDIVVNQGSINPLRSLVLQPVQDGRLIVPSPCRVVLGDTMFSHLNRGYLTAFHSDVIFFCQLSFVRDIQYILTCIRTCLWKEKKRLYVIFHDYYVPNVL